MSTDFDDAKPEIEMGQVFRVLSVAADGTVLLEMPGGAIGRLRENRTGLTPGSAYFVTDSGFEELQLDEWPGGDRTGVVIWADSESVIVKSGNTNFAHSQQTAEPFKKGQTVRLDAHGKPFSVVTDEPVDDPDFLHDDPFVIDELIIKPGDNPTTLDDFGGNPRLVSRAVDLATVALDADEPLKTIGVNPIKGMLFSGPSGTGKTHLARALASRLGATFYNIAGPTIVDKFVGQTEQRLRDIFEHARKNAPAILFFDEIDSLYTQRSEQNHEATNRLVGQFLSLLDGFVTYERVFIIATTNLPGALDSALLRPGRLGQKLVFELPKATDRELILKASGRKVIFAAEPDLALVAAATEGWSAADLAAIWTEAGLAAVLDRRSSIAAEDIAIGIERVAQDRNAQSEVRQ